MLKLRSYLLLGICFLFHIAGKANGIFFFANHPNIQYTGRIDFSDPLQPTYQFPGVSIKAKFNGTSVSATLYDYGTGGVSHTNYYKVIIDGIISIEQLAMSTGEANYSLTTGLTVGEHTVEIIKITEGSTGKSSFKGFTITGGAETLVTPDPRPSKKIEFIGDSWTCGYGNLSNFTTGNASMVNSNFISANEDNYYAWGPIVARTLGAEYQVTAISGRGLFRNNTGSTNGTLPKNYDNIFEDDKSKVYDHSVWHPDIVSIHLGTNDMALEENGQTYKMNDSIFQHTYIDFINKIIGYYPCVTVIICFGNSKSDAWPTWTKQLTRLRTIASTIVNAYPNGNVTKLELPYTAEKWTGNPADDCGYGDAWHPTVCSHNEMGSKLLQKINSLSINWGNSSGCNYIFNDPYKSTGIVDFVNDSLVLFPNPATNSLTVKGGDVSYWGIYNQLGAKVLEGNTSTIAIESLTPGSYIIEFVINGIRYRENFLKSK